MKCNRLILTVFVVSCVLLLQTGCQEEQTKVAKEPAVALEKPRAPITPPKTEAATETSASAPEITFEKTVHDFGKIGPGTKNMCELKFTNTGGSLLKINKVSKTCGCTPFALAKREYAPGEEGVLKVRYNSSKRPGLISKHLFVSSNDKANPNIKLTIKAMIVLKVDHEPKKLKLLLKQENAGCPEIVLTSIDGQPFSIKRFRSTDNCITADYDSAVKDTKFVLQPKVDMEKLQKNLKGRLDISLTHPECDLLTVSFSVLERFSVDPPSIIIFKAEAQKPVTREIWILSNYDEDFEIESTSSKKGYIKVLSQEKVGKRYKFKLEIMPPVAEEKLKIFADVFSVKIKGGKTLKITCRGFYSREWNKQSN